MSSIPSHREPHLRAVGTSFLRLRPWIVAPMMLNTVATLAFSGAPARQVGALSGMFPLVLGFFAREALAGRRRLVTERAFFTSLAVTVAAITFACAATGGVASPVLPMLFAPTVIAFAAFGRSRRSDAFAALFALSLAVLALLPQGFPFPPAPQRAHRWMLLVCALDAAALLRVGVSSLSDAYASSQGALSVASADVIAAARARTRTLEALGATVAHEIKNPLAAVRGLVELLREDITDPRQRRRLDVAHAEVARIESILRDYLGFARPLSSLTLAPCDLGAVARDVVVVLEATAARKNIALHGDGPALPLTADATRVKEALLNLALNALEATPTGGRVDVTWSADVDRASVAVRDTGPGLDDVALARLGEPFYTTRDDGTGLGVHLARQAATQHGGALTYASSPGAGTVATLTLPLRREDAP